MHHDRSSNEHGGSHLWKGIVAGLAGGLAASWTMNRFQDVWSRLTEASQQSANLLSSQESKPEANQQEPPSDGAQDDTTVRTASAISEGLFQHKLTPKEKKIGGTA